MSAHSGRAGGAGQGRGNGDGGLGSRGPDPFFWAYLAAVAIAVVAAIATPVKRPGYALNCGSPGIDVVKVSAALQS